MTNFSILDNKKKQLENVLRNLISNITNQDSLINLISSYALFPTGKQLRSLLTLLMYDMLGGTKGNIYTCACTTEMIHTATLLLDDLPCMDNSSYRRGKLSCHKKFGEADTILIAFGLASESFRVLTDENNLQGIDSYQSLHMIQEISHKIGFNGLIGGQIADLNKGNTLVNNSSEQQKLAYITNNKTVTLFEVCALIACCLAEAHTKDKKHMIAYAHNVGLALQIFDDLHDDTEDKGLSFSKIYGTHKAQHLLQQAIKESHKYITYSNDTAHLLKTLPQFLVEGTI